MGKKKAKAKPKARDPSKRRLPRMDTGILPQPGEWHCGIEGCTRPARKGKGTCDVHRDIEVDVLCEVEGCKEKVRAKGKCFNHYQNQRRRARGDVTGSYERPARRTNPLSTRVSDECLAALEGKGQKKGVTASEVLENWARTQSC